MIKIDIFLNLKNWYTCINKCIYRFEYANYIDQYY